jgi:phosphate transport system protein
MPHMESKATGPATGDGVGSAPSGHGEIGTLEGVARQTDLRSAFHQQLADVDRLLTDLLHLVTGAVRDATEALLRDDAAAAVEIGSRRHLADPLYEEVEHKVAALMAREGPVASDLRYLLAVLRAVPELEQSADLADGIAHKGSQGLAEVLSPRARAMITRIGDLVTAMWSELSERWDDHGGEAEDRLEAARDELDDLHTSLTAEIAACGLAASATMDMALIGRFYERLGDHAVNIARRLDQLSRWPSATPIVKPD